jgi:hypothetical protein
LRFWNYQLREERDVVRFEIWYALMERTGQHEKISDYLPRTAPSPQPSPPVGERGKSAVVRASAVSRSPIHP